MITVVRVDELRGGDRVLFDGRLWYTVLEPAEQIETQRPGETFWQARVRFYHGGEMMHCLGIAPGRLVVERDEDAD